MYDAVSSYLDRKSVLWASIPKVGEFKNAFTAVITQIDTVQYEQQQAQVFLGKTKTQIKSVVAEKADILNDSVEAFASITGDENLVQKFYLDWGWRGNYNGWFLSISVTKPGNGDNYIKYRRMIDGIKP